MSNTPENSTAPKPSDYLVGMQWDVLLDGKNCLNGKIYGMKIGGDIEDLEPEMTIWETLHVLIDHCESEANCMEFVMALTFTMRPTFIAAPSSSDHC